MRIFLALILGFFSLAFLAGGFKDLRNMPGWWPEKLHPSIIDINNIDATQSMPPGDNWWLIKGGTPRFDLQTIAGTTWEQSNGVVTTLPEIYYVPFASCPTLAIDTIKLVVALNADIYEKLQQSDDPFAFDRPHGLVRVIKHPNPNINISPPFLLMSYHSTPEQPKNPWIDFSIGLLLLGVTSALAVWRYRRP